MIIYSGFGNRIYATFIKAEVIGDDEYNRKIYIVKILKDYGSNWQGRSPQIGSRHQILKVDAHKTFEKAKERLFKDMEFEKDSDLIKFIFEKEE